MTENAKILEDQISPKIVVSFQTLEPPLAAAAGQRFDGSHRHRDGHQLQQAATRVHPENNENRHFRAAGEIDEENLKIFGFSFRTRVNC